MDPNALKQYLADDPPTIVKLEIKPHFEALTARQKRYAHHLSQAAFSGTRIVLRQCSPHAESIYELISELHAYCKGDWESLREQSGLSPEELRFFLDYAAQFLGNGGNFKSFGDTKFIPRLSARQFKALATCSPETLHLYELAAEEIYGTSDEAGMLLGFPDSGHVSGYYPDSSGVGGIKKAEIEEVSAFLEKKGLLPENTRLRKMKGSGNFELLVASAEKQPASADHDIKGTEFELSGALSGKKLKIVFGDYASEMAKIVHHMSQAAAYAADDTQKAMCEAYAKSFNTGSLNAFLESQRQWIRDKGPVVETNIGFIETYRDPAGIRGEWEGFVSMVNKERTRAFSKLVEAAPTQIPKLPWSAAFEKDKFLAPDFTSLEVLTFASSGIPAGINIPNYDQIRQSEGFKNVSLGNVLSAKAPDKPIPFIKDADQALYKEYRDQAFEVQVGLHELLGHGCGKLLQETAPGVYNFDHSNPPTSPLTGKPVTTWYKPGQTWGSMFGALAGAYEECRAECVAMYLCCDFGILSIFGFGDGTESEENMRGEAGDILYAAYLSMAAAGVAAVEFWDPNSKKWGQAHMQARFSILKTFLSAGKEFCELQYEKEDLSDLSIKLDRSKIITHGRPMVEKYLQKLGIYKATADVEAGKAMFEGITSVDEWWGGKLRKEVLRRKVPRKVFVQANTILEGEDVKLKEYEPTAEGMIESFADRTYI